MPRHLFLAALVLGAVANSGRCEDKAIPQDLKRMEEARRTAREFYRKQYIESYDRAGDRNEKWDAVARQALEHYITWRMTGYRSEANVALHQVAELANTACERGCRDPFIVFLRIRARDHVQVVRADAGKAERAELTKECEPLVTTMVPGNYAPAVKVEFLAPVAVAIHRNTEVKTDLVNRNVSDRLVYCSMQVAKVAGGSSPIELNEAAYLLKLCSLEARKVNKTPKLWRDRVLKDLEKANSSEAFREYAKGDFLIDAAWEARGDGVGATVTESGAETFWGRLREAEIALKKAHRAAPDWALPAAVMIDVCRGLGHERDEMEKWFIRAITADGDCDRACEAKCMYLMPRWHGDADSVVAFGRQCRDTKNWHAGLPQQLRLAHHSIPAGRMPLKQYLSHPQVWTDIASIYEPLLKEKPDADGAKTHYFRMAVAAGQVKLADRLQRELGERIWLGAFANQTEYETLTKAGRELNLPEDPDGGGKDR